MTRRWPLSKEVIDIAGGTATRVKSSSAAQPRIRGKARISPLEERKDGSGGVNTQLVSSNELRSAATFICASITGSIRGLESYWLRFAYETHAYPTP